MSLHPFIDYATLRVGMLRVYVESPEAFSAHKVLVTRHSLSPTVLYNLRFGTSAHRAFSGVRVAKVRMVGKREAFRRRGDVEAI